MSPLAEVRATLIGLVTGVLGALAAVILLVWPRQSPPNVVGYPFTSTGYYVAQTIFFVHHFGLLVLLVALARSDVLGPRRVYRAGAWLAVVGMFLLSVSELLAMRYTGWDFATAYAGLMGIAYGVSCTTIGVGMLLAGIGVLRTAAWAPAYRWTPIAVGIGLFVLVIPGIRGGFVTARLGIGFWMLQFAALGWSMYRQSTRVTSHPAPGGHDHVGGVTGMNARSR